MFMSHVLSPESAGFMDLSELRAQTDLYKLIPDRVQRTGQDLDPMKPCPSDRAALLMTRLGNGRTNKLRAACMERAGGRCQICGVQQPLTLTKLWAYDWSAGVQVLDRLVPMCRACFVCHNMGQAKTGAARVALIQHVAAVNGCEHAFAQQLTAYAWNVFSWRNQRRWKVALSDWIINSPV